MPLDMENQFSIFAITVQGNHEVNATVFMSATCRKTGNHWSQPTLLHLCAQSSGFVVLIFVSEISPQNPLTL